jgi:hypothetical protein
MHKRRKKDSVCVILVPFCGEKILRSVSRPDQYGMRLLAVRIQFNHDWTRINTNKTSVSRALATFGQAHQTVSTQTSTKL